MDQAADRADVGRDRGCGAPQRFRVGQRQRQDVHLRALRFEREDGANLPSDGVARVAETRPLIARR